MDLRLFCEPQQGASYDDLLACALAAEESGFSAFFRSDHYLAMGDADGLPGPTDAWVNLAGLARDTTTIRLGTLVSPATFRLPGPLALQVAQVDQMSGGRVELGLGAGWFDAEHRAYGIPFLSSFGERFDNLEEQLEIVTGMWATPEGETFSFEGRRHRLSDCPALPKPAQTPGPPIVVGGHGPKRTPALAARFAAEINIGFCQPHVAGAQFERVRAACEAIGRDPDDIVLSVALPTACGRDAAEVEWRAADRGATVEQMRQSGMAGTPAEIAEQLRGYQAVGATRAYLQFIPLQDLDHVRLAGNEVPSHL